MTEEKVPEITHEQRDAADIERLRGRGFFVRKNENRYDRKNLVDSVMVMHAGALKMGAYRVRDPETDEWSPLQYHLTYDNTVLAVLSESSAKLFCTMVERVNAKTP